MALALFAPAAEAQSAATGYVELPGVRLWYQDTGGRGIPVVLLHPVTGTTESWVFQYPALTAAGYRVIAYDRRGSGRSVADPASGTAPGTEADDLQVLMKHLQVERFHLVASGAGAFCALDFALSHGAQLRSLVIANSIGGIQDPEFLELGRRLRPSPQFDALPVEFKELGPSYRAADKDGTERWLKVYRSSLPGSSLPGGRPPPWPAPKNQITLAALGSLTTPTLLITGDADLYAPPPVQELFRARIRGAASVVIAEAGHSAYWEKPQQFNRSLLAFLKKH